MIRKQNSIFKKFWYELLRNTGGLPWPSHPIQYIHGYMYTSVYIRNANNMQTNTQTAIQHASK